MKTIKDPETKILNMKIISEEPNEENDKKIRLEKLKVYQQFKKYKSMMNVYTRQKNVANLKNLLKINDPSKSLENFFKMEGLDPSKDIDQYRDFKRVVDHVRSENPDLGDLRDVTSSSHRKVISDIINKTQKGKEICATDLDFVAVIEGYGLYSAMSDIQYGKDRKDAIQKNGITEEMLQNAEARKRIFDEETTKSLYQRAYQDMDEIIFITAGVLEIGIGEAKTDLESFGVIHTKEREIDRERDLLVEKEEPQEYKMMIFERALNKYKGDPELTKQTVGLMEDYLNKIEEHNKYREALEKSYRRKNNGNPSPVFLRELKEYKERNEVGEKKILEDDREIG